MTRNDSDRSDWIANDEGLYNWCRRWMRTNKGGERGFIRENRAAIDGVIDNVVGGSKPAHYLEYDHSAGCRCYGCR